MKKLIVMVFGCFLMAAGFGCMILPMGFASGGVTGLARILCGVVPLPLSVVVLLINITLFGAGYVFVGKEFVMKSLVCALLFPVFLQVCQSVDVLLFLKQEPLIASCIAGILVGAGAGLVLRVDASSGGLDVIGVIVEKKTGIPVSVTNACCDGLVLLIQGMSGAAMSVVYGLLVVIVISLTIRRMMTAGTGTVQMMIFTDCTNEIREMLLHQADAGVTLFETVSGLRDAHSRTVLTVVPFRKAYRIRKMVNGIDPTAFVTMSDVRSVVGRGYTMPAV
ncbi:MAG: YitT family protein [Bulleidia sp.]